MQPGGPFFRIRRPKWGLTSSELSPRTWATVALYRNRFPELSVRVYQRFNTLASVMDPLLHLLPLTLWILCRCWWRPAHATSTASQPEVSSSPFHDLSPKTVSLRRLARSSACLRPLTLHASRKQSSSAAGATPRCFCLPPSVPFSFARTCSLTRHLHLFSLSSSLSSPLRVSLCTLSLLSEACAPYYAVQRQEDPTSHRQQVKYRVHDTGHSFS